MVHNEHEKFQKIPFLCNRFFQIENKNFQIQILKILSQVKYDKNKKFIYFLKLSLKKLLHISYCLQAIKILKTTKFLKSNKKHKSIKNDEKNVKVKIKDLEILMSQLNLKFNDLYLINSKVNVRKSNKFFVLNKEEICQNIFYTNR